MEKKAIAVGALKSALGAMRKDLDAMPESAFEHHFGGKSRTVADIIHEVNMVNDDICRNMKGEPASEWPEGWVTAPEGQRDKVSVLAAFDRSSEAVLALAEGSSEEDMSAKVITEHGETDRFERFRFVALHVWYHSGQLNFIQTLLGDDAWHW